MNALKLIRHGLAPWLAVVVAAACAAPSGDREELGAGAQKPPGELAVAGDASATPDAAGATDPFAPQPDESEGLTNVAADLDAILEHGALKGACDRYRAGQVDRKTTLLCGKWMYFYESFGTSGVPSAILKFLAQNFPDELGYGFEKLGMILDPSSPDKLPLGLAPTAPLEGKFESLAFTCASCHFGRLPDGRYAVGAPNHDYDYGRHILSISLAPSVGLGRSKAADHDASAIAKVQPVLDKIAGSLTLKAKFGLALLPLASLKQPGMSPEVERQYASWGPGTLDFVIAPLPIDDGVHVVGKMMGLWGIPREAEIKSSGMADAMLAWTGDTGSLEEFLRGFAIFGGVTPPTPQTFKPLVEYVHSLRAPANPAPPAPALVAEGQSLFASKGCATCHDGPRGSGKRVFSFDEIGTDRALAKWIDPTTSGAACCGLSSEVPPGMLKHGVKSPRLVGTWALRRFLHNGSVSLDELFCLKDRPKVQEESLRAEGHAFTCDGLTKVEREALKAYVLAH
ncbi:MAG: hypothetical protein IPG50_36680 [Myxococcales bacterium]|nr:hypothetical protein [Myxococcales bacterium]